MLVALALGYFIRSNKQKANFPTPGPTVGVLHSVTMPPPNIFIYKITENITDHFQAVDAHVNLSDNTKNNQPQS
jgi:hypothetical protein